LPTPDVTAGVVRSYRRRASPRRPHVHRRTALFQPCRRPLGELPSSRWPEATRSRGSLRPAVDGGVLSVAL